MSIFSTVSSDISDTGPSIPNTTLNNTISSQTPPNLIPTSTQSHVHHSRLPKLTLPTFSGDSPEWLSFWGSFDAAVNKKYGLSDIEKFNYLQAQLTGEAERAIGGFSLTSSNYAKAIDTLHKRFGQSSKIINAHMSALLELPQPYNRVSSLKSFFDDMETNIRALEALGKFQDTFGDLLVPVTLRKLPDETKQNLARSQKGTEWSIQERRGALKNELRVLEAGTNPLSVSTSTASLFAGVKGSNSESNQMQRANKNRACVFCKGAHTPSKCTVIVDPKMHKSIVSRGGLCFNCLSSTHRSAQCPSKYRCRFCGGKHYRTICERSNPPVSSPTPTPTRTNNPSDPADNTQQRHAIFTPAQK